MPKLEEINSNENVATLEKEKTSSENNIDAVAPVASVEEIATQKANDQKIAGEAISSVREQISTSADLKPMAGKLESLPQTAEQKRLFDNIGYSAESLAKDKESFSGLTGGNLYNKTQVITLQRTVDFMKNIKGDLDPKQQTQLTRLMNSVQLQVNEINAEAPKKALKDYPTMMKILNTPTGTSVYSGLSDIFKKAGYKTSFFNSKAGFENFQKDLSSELLSSEQQEELANMEEIVAKQGNKATSNKNVSMGGSIGSGGGSKMKESIYSSMSAEELNK
ncbi:MAG: hypothetical protein WCK37_03185 [Candidatus Falkowbacteria bacterium]